MRSESSRIKSIIGFFKKRQDIINGSVLKENVMRTVYQIKSEEFGTVRLKKRKIAKALRLWLSENGFTYQFVYFSN